MIFSDTVFVRHGFFFSLFLEIKSNIFICVYIIIIIIASYSFFFQSFTCDLSMLSDSCIAYYSMVISNCCPIEIKPEQ